MAPASEMTHVDKRKAQAAYSALDVDASAATHATRVSGGHDEDHSNVGSRLKTLVFGGLDGILTSFAIVSSCAGSEMDARVVLLLGACNILADALAMGVGEYLSTKSSDEYARRERAREDWEMRNHPEGEIDEMIEIYVQRGMSKADATTVISTMSKYHDFFVDARGRRGTLSGGVAVASRWHRFGVALASLWRRCGVATGLLWRLGGILFEDRAAPGPPDAQVMMVEELGLQVPEPDSNVEAAKDGFLMFLAFVCFGSMPLLGYVISPRLLGERAMSPHDLFLAARRRSRWGRSARPSRIPPASCSPRRSAAREVVFLE
mmetsp:Transcript_27134/g.83602  ORF Transcript_27134/g.83602 Transcript_27134/m.83602 type:complete len:320 (-) Transcript_27134:906-1865(-)